jgi:hypothetical protein
MASTVSGKATKAEVAKRVEAVFELRLGGAGFTDIREYAAAPTDRDGTKQPPWGVSDSQLRRYIAAADRLCKERYDSKADHLLARHLLRRERLYAHALEVGDYKTALAVLKDEAELEGHYGRANAELPAEGEGAATLGAADLAALLSAAVKQARKGQLDPRAASTLAGLSAALLRVQERGEMEERLQALERLLLGGGGKADDGGTEAAAGTARGGGGPPGGGGDAAADPAAGGLGPNPGGRGLPARPLADGPASLDIQEDVTPLFPAERQEPGGRRPSSA